MIFHCVAIRFWILEYFKVFQIEPFSSIFFPHKLFQLRFDFNLESTLHYQIITIKNIQFIYSNIVGSLQCIDNEAYRVHKYNVQLLLL